jgi:hypothetical protein
MTLTSMRQVLVAQARRFNRDRGSVRLSPPGIIAAKGTRGEGRASPRQVTQQREPV